MHFCIQLKPKAEYLKKFGLWPNTEAEADCYSDCKHVVDLFLQGAGRYLSLKLQYSGLIIFRVSGAGPKLASLAKVDAPKDLEELGISAREQFIRRGNFFADAGAKRAVSWHPQFSANDMAQVDLKVKIARCVMDLAAAVLPLFPRVEFRGLERVPPPPPPSQEQRVPHRWKHMSGFWRCRVCLRGSASLSCPVEGSCRGHSRLDSVVLDRLQHRVIALECSDNSQM